MTDPVYVASIRWNWGALRMECFVEARPDLDGEPIDVMGLIAVVEHPEGFVPFVAVRTDLPDRELALFCRAAAIRFERLHDVGPEADGWIVRRNGKGIEMTIGWSDMPALDY